MINALERLGTLPGMLPVKVQVEQMIQFRRVSDMRRREGLKTQKQSNHMIFTGNPGTGKTTAARLIGEAFAALNLLKSSRDEVPFVEIHLADIIHPHVGQAERNLVAKFNESRGGVLFIDEAYAFADPNASGGRASQNEGIIATLVQSIEDMRDEVIVIAAGYPDEMQELLSENPGLRSRFPTTIHFPDYSIPELVAIAESMFADQEYCASQQYVDLLSRRLLGERTKPGFGNARTVRNIVEQSIRMHSVRVAQLPSPSRDELLWLTADDIQVAQAQKSEKGILLAELQRIQAHLFEIELREIISHS